MRDIEKTSKDHERTCVFYYKTIRLATRLGPRKVSYGSV